MQAAVTLIGRSADLLTVRDLLRYATSQFGAAKLHFAHGAKDARDEAAFLLLEALHLPHVDWEQYLDARLLAEERENCLRLIDERVQTRRPAPYLVGKAYIAGVPFYVDERVLVPRSYIGYTLRSELMLGAPDALVPDPSRIRRVLDLCTGSGCLAVIAAMTFPDAEVDAVDLSADALAVAQRNVAEFGSDRIHLFQGDLFEPLRGRRYDLILTNPPYVDASSMQHLPAEHAHEPRMALAGGADGLDIVRRILRDAPRHLTEVGGLLCEFGRGRSVLESEYPQRNFRWLSDDTCFWLAA